MHTVIAKDTRGNALHSGDHVRLVSFGLGCTAEEVGLVGTVVGLARTRVRVALPGGVHHIDRMSLVKVTADNKIMED